MSAKTVIPHTPGLTLADIYHILFRHKWKILILSAAGIVAALVLPRIQHKVYESEAKLLIEYVLESRAPSRPGTDDARVTVSDGQSGSIINTEIEILKSLDLAREVATNIGPERILAEHGGGSDANAAAVVVRDGLFVDVPSKSDVVRLAFRHTDPQLVSPVLAEVIRTYLERHADIHLAVGRFDEFLTKQTDQLKSGLANTEAELRSVKTNLNIVSIDDSRKVFGDQMGRIQQSIFDAEAELAEHQAVIAELSKLVSTNQSQAASTNQNSTDASGEIALSALKPVPEDKIAENKRLSDLLDALHSRERELLLQFLPENSRVKEVREQIAAVQKDKTKLEQENPGLLTMKAADGKISGAPSGAPGQGFEANLLAEKARITALQAKIRTWTNQIAYIKDRAAAVDANEGRITDLERTRKLEEGYYTYYSANLTQSRIDEELGPGKASNISTIQNPSPPYPVTGKMAKVIKILPVAGIAAGLALAFLLELYFDRSFKRPAEIEASLGVPLLLSVPYRNGNNTRRLLRAPAGSMAVLRSDALGRAFPLNGAKITIGRMEDNVICLDDDSVSRYHCEVFTHNGEIVVKDLGSTHGTFVNGKQIVETPLKAGETMSAGNVEFQLENEKAQSSGPTGPGAHSVVRPWDPRHALRPFYDTLRDRLITYFEVKNLTHKPKLVALTSCGDGSGVTTTAAGLAAALSETGEGNVLLVDMNAERGAAHHFHRGELACGLDEALQLEKRHEARVQDNLYVVTEAAANGDNLPSMLPKRFTHLVPKLKASDYDYIIFDMPPISQISITPRLARYMDMIMVVVESEKTDRNVVQRAVRMLTEARANVGVVLNKQKNYVPRRLQQEL
jgi:uncharacterized protein involved in exopolysaccharide biosynthesis/Mrp family chromosome partitioning ATPase